MSSKIILLLLLSTAALLVASAGERDGSIHDLLREHGLPPGLLPKTVESYTLNRSTGFLEVQLDRPLLRQARQPRLLFDQVVRGNLSYGQLRSVVGLEQEELFLWLPICGILVSDPSSGVILFDIGVARKQLSLSLFETPPDCSPVGSEPPAKVVGDVQILPKGLLGRKQAFQDQR
ncbi:hypothetical protein HPP92_013662 [Vanilla planifolia]|uniref:Uncharacterized protein n=1 Tax=Vanilla planifolia TaxID=51239 RepID=A0A835UZ20_VANPL|nr:hypothetical protein HPP92_013662 [Vanilla planifolia]